MNKDIFTRILEDNEELSSLPQIVAEILKVARDPNASTTDLSKAIMKDPSLTVRVLRVVNSPYYSPAQPVSTISQAVKTLGSRPIIAMALAASIYNLVSNIEGGISRKRFWRHSLESALAAQSIARAVNYESPEEAFICGLLHDIGILILEASFEDTYRRIWKQVEIGEKLINVEEEQWGTNHARVGQFLMRQWGLPELLCDAVGGHHTIFGEEDSHKHQKIILITNLANRVSKFKIGNIPPPEALVIELKKTIIKNISIDIEDLAEIERNLISEVVNESGYLEIDIGNVEEILGQANRILYEQYMTVENMLLEKRQSSNKSALERTNEKVFFEFLDAISRRMKKRTILLKDAMAKGDLNDGSGYVDETIKDVTNWSQTVSLILEEQKKSITVDNYWDSYSFQDFKNICSNLLEINQQKKEAVKS